MTRIQIRTCGYAPGPASQEPTGAITNRIRRANESTCIDVRSCVGDGSRVFSCVSEAWHCPDGLDPGRCRDSGARRRPWSRPSWLARQSRSSLRLVPWAWQLAAPSLTAATGPVATAGPGRDATRVSAHQRCAGEPIDHESARTSPRTSGVGRGRCHRLGRGTADRENRAGKSSPLYGVAATSGLTPTVDLQDPIAIFAFRPQAVPHATSCSAGHSCPRSRHSLSAGG